MTYTPSVRAVALSMGYKTCPPCVAAGDDDPKGPVHRDSGQVWDDRLGRARAHGGTDPETGVTAEFAEAHLALATWPAKHPGRTCRFDAETLAVTAVGAPPGRVG